MWRRGQVAGGHLPPVPIGVPARLDTSVWFRPSGHQSLPELSVGFGKGIDVTTVDAQRDPDQPIDLSQHFVVTEISLVVECAIGGGVEGHEEESPAQRRDRSERRASTTGCQS